MQHLDPEDLTKKIEKIVDIHFFSVGGSRDRLVSAISHEIQKALKLAAIKTTEDEAEHRRKYGNLNETLYFGRLKRNDR